jgi:hypothetical protein
VVALGLGVYSAMVTNGQTADQPIKIGSPEK